MIEREPCMAEVHAPKLRGREHFATSYDHFTPRCLIRACGLDRSLLKGENLIPMHSLCHHIKDQTTPELLQDVYKRRKKGGLGHYADYWQEIELNGDKYLIRK